MNLFLRKNSWFWWCFSSSPQPDFHLEKLQMDTQARLVQCVSIHPPSGSTSCNRFASLIWFEWLERMLPALWHFSSVQFSCSVVSDSLQPHESQHTRPPCPSPIPGVHSNSHPSSRWCHPAISSSVIPSPPAPNPSQHQSLFQWVNSSHEVAKVLEFQL